MLRATKSKPDESDRIQTFEELEANLSDEIDDVELHEGA